MGRSEGKNKRNPLRMDGSMSNPRGSNNLFWRWWRGTGLGCADGL
jgi:hypothetical protein